MKVDKGKKTFEWMSKARSGRGFAYWQRAGVALRNEENTSAQEDLSLALDDLQWAVKHATDFDRPAILNRLGEVYFLQGQYQETAEVWMRSLREAKDIKDCFTELHSLSDLARLAFYCSIKGFESYLDFKDYYNDYKKRYSPVFFEILRGLFFTYLGHLAFSEEDLGWAVRFYQEGLPLLAHKGTYTPFNIRGQLDFMEREIIPNMSTEFVIELIKGLKQWGERREEDYGAIALMRFREWEEQAISGEKFQEGIYA
jgi:tetratricopeptide (TPR) repeat protein